MAIDKLSLYNDALTLIGQRTLTGLTEDREPRYLLDNSYDLGAIKYCLEVVKPVFARKTVKLNSVTPSPEHDLDNVYELPSDYISMVEVYSDPKLDQKISRYILDGNTLSCEYQTIYLRYVNDAPVSSFANWSQSFARVVSAYLAREISVKLSPKATEGASTEFNDRVESAKLLDAEREPVKRSSQTTNTLNNEWRNIYNDALLIMGLDEISSNDDDSNRRTKLDRALDAGIVSELLETTGWTFAVTSTRSQYDPSLETEWGYTRTHAKPADMHRLDGIFYDEYMRQPLKLYHDEGGNIFCDEDEFYIQYISENWLVNPSSWPTFFRKLVAAKMANDTAPSLKKEGADVDNAKTTYEKRENEAKAVDAMAAPPRVLSAGKWAGSRFKGNYRGRP